MSFQGYKLDSANKKRIFTFESVNPVTGRTIQKVVSYDPVTKAGAKYYNLGFADYDPRSNRLLSDTDISDNGDMRKVIATVASTLEPFFQKHPQAIVHIEGSDQTRHDYYHKLIRDYGKMIPDKYDIEGFVDKENRIEPFQAGRKYKYI